jgi:predicted aspartyl protease
MTTPGSGPLPQVRAFTVKHPQRVLVLSSEVEIFPASLASQTPLPGKKYIAIYDTGATHSAISPKVVNDLGLTSIGAAQVHAASGTMATTSHLVNIGLPNKVRFPMVRVTKATLKNCDVLIGMDILGAGDFAVTNHQGKTTFSYRYPAQGEIDFVAQPQQKPASARSNKVGRNDQCPCGSGKKYKRCHGANA